VRRLLLVVAAVLSVVLVAAGWALVRSGDRAAEATRHDA